MSRIVLVDDDEATLKLYCAIIRRELGEEPCAYANPRDALAALTDFRPSLVIVDYYMPEMDGLAFTRALRCMPSFTTIPVLMLTASSDQKLGRRALAAGATSFVEKPISLKDFSRTLHRLTGREAAPRATVGEIEPIAVQVTRARKLVGELRAIADRIERLTGS